MELKAAIIGCGAIGVGEATRPHPDVGAYSHAEAYAACPDVELVAVADRDSARAQIAARSWGAEPYTDLPTLLTTARPDLVSLCAPDATHAELLEQILGAPGIRGVLAEKPLAVSAASAAKLGELAHARGVTLAVNYSRRFAPPIAELSRSIATGDFGELQHVHGSYTGGLRHNGTHWLDLLRMLVGEPVAVRGWDRLGEDGSDPSLDAELSMAGGATARLAALDARGFTAFEFELTGTAGRVRLASSGHRIERWTVGADELHPGYRALVPAPSKTAALRDVTAYAVADLARCVRGGGRPACTARDATRALVLAEAIAASAAAGSRTISV